MKFAVLVGLSLGLVAAARAAQDARPAARAAGEIYQPVEPQYLVHYFQVDTDEPDMGKLKAGLGEVGAAILYGPRVTQARPGHAFLAVQAPPSLEPKKLAAQVKRAGGQVHALACTAFVGRKDEPTSTNIAGFNLTTRDLVMGISGKIAWFETVGSWSQFYVEPGAIKAQEIAHRYAKLYEPYGGGTLGQLVREKFTWKLAPPPPAKQADKLLKAVRKLPGVVEAELSGDGQLTLTLELSGIEQGIPAGTLQTCGDKPLDEQGLEAPRAAWNSAPLLALLATEQLLPATNAAATDAPK